MRDFLFTTISMIPFAFSQLLNVQTDIHNCVLQSGYTWCELSQKCIRLWEDSCITIDSECSIQCPPPVICPVPYMNDINLDKCRTVYLTDSCGCAIGCPTYDCYGLSVNTNEGCSKQLTTDIPPIMGTYVPQCADGKYISIQCHESIGYCWCVSQDGIEISGTKSMCRGPCRLNENICNEIQLHQLCDNDNDCYKNQFCRVTTDEYYSPCECSINNCDCIEALSICIDKSPLDYICGRYTSPAYRTVCDDSLECVNNLGRMIVDGTGLCKKSCNFVQKRDKYSNCVSDIPSKCATWYDGCNTCQVENGKATICTLMYCTENAEPYCTSYYYNYESTMSERTISRPIV